MFLLDVLQFHKAADSGTSGAGKPSEDKSYIDKGHSEMFGDTGDTLDKLISEDNPPAEPDKTKPEDSASTDLEQPPEGTEPAKEGEPQVAKKEVTPEAEVKATEEEGKEPVYLINDKEVEESRISQALETHANMEKWRTNLTQRGQLQALFDRMPIEEQALALERLKPIIYNQQPIPKGLDTSKPFKVKTKDEDGYENEIEIPWDSPEVKEIGNQVRTAMEKEYEPVRQENETLRSNQLKTDLAFGEVVLTYFLKTHPEMDVRDKGQSLRNAMETISIAGEDHPKFPLFMKLTNLMESVQKHKIYGPDALERSFTMLYGPGIKVSQPMSDGSDKEKAIIEQQKKKLGLGGGTSSEVKDEEEKMLEKMHDRETAIHGDLIEEAINKKK